jgi:hypothetical protein
VQSLRLPPHQLKILFRDDVPSISPIGDLQRIASGFFRGSLVQRLDETPQLSAVSKKEGLAFRCAAVVIAVKGQNGIAAYCSRKARLYTLLLQLPTLPELGDYSLVFTEERNRARTTCHIKIGAEMNIRFHRRLGS